jgi:hypothetical protein
VFEASFCAICVLDPNDSRERRRRGLRLEILDSKEQRNWIDSLKHVGVDEEASDANTQWQAGATRVYKSEADALGLNWVRATQPVNLV